jgi:structure-specific recognition protein 1
MNVKGYNWGSIDTKSNLLAFRSPNGDEIFSLNMGEIKTVQQVGKTQELSIDLQDESEVNEDSLVQVKFLFPKEGEKDLEIIQKSIQEHIEKSGDAADLVCTFDKLSFVAPRGKYTVEIFRKYMRFSGGTHVFKVTFKQIIQMFLLPKPGTKHMYFVISLEAPVRLTRKPYFHIAFHFDKSDMIDSKNPVNLKLTKEEFAMYAEKKIGEKMNGHVFEVVAKVIRALSGKKIIGTNQGYHSFEGFAGVKCSSKANEGVLYFLEKSLLFLYKPTLYIKYDEIKSIKMARTGTDQAKTFDMTVHLKSAKSHPFSNIQSQERDNIVKLFNAKSIKMDNLHVESKTAGPKEPIVLDEDESSEDDDFIQDDGDESEDEDFEEGGPDASEKGDENPSKKMKPNDEE